MFFTATKQGNTDTKYIIINAVLFVCYLALIIACFILDNVDLLNATRLLSLSLLIKSIFDAMLLGTHDSKLLSWLMVVTNILP